MAERLNNKLSLRATQSGERSEPLSLRAKAKQSNFRASLFAKAAGAALAIIGAGKAAQAQTIVPFGPDINAVNEISFNYTEFVPGISRNRVRMMFPSLLRNNGRTVPPDGQFAGSYNAAEFELRRNADGSLNLVQVGNSVDTINIGYVGRGVDYVHPDGRTTQVRDPMINPVTGEVIGDLSINGQERWGEYNPVYGERTCIPGADGYYDVPMGYIARGTLPNELLVIADFLIPGGTPDNPMRSVGPWRVDITVPNLCADIQNRINAAITQGQTLVQAGVAFPCGGAETIGVDETMVIGTYAGTWPHFATYLSARDPVTGVCTELQRNADGTWTPETGTRPGRSEPTLGNTISSAVHKMEVTDEDGAIHKYHLFVVADGDHETTSILKAFALEETGPNAFREVTLTMSQTPTPADDDGDGIPNGDDKCAWRANPSAVDEHADGMPDGTPDACQVNSCAKWPGIDQPSSPDETAECASELGYPHALTFVADGSTAHSNEPIEIDSTGAIAVKPGQEVRYIHSKDPRVDCTSQSAPVCESRRIKFPDGNSVHFKLNETDKLDGTPGVATFSQIPLDDPFGEPVVATFSSPTTGWMDYDPGIGAILGSEGSDMTVRAGNENLPIPTCPPVCPPVDGGPADGGNDGGETPDAQPNPEDGGGAQDGAVEQPDGGPANDGGVPDANGDQPDAQPNPDSGEGADGNGNLADGGDGNPDANGESPDASSQAGDAGPSDGGSEIATDSGATEKPKPPVCGCATPKDIGANTLNQILLVLSAAGAFLRRRKTRKE